MRVLKLFSVVACILMINSKAAADLAESSVKAAVDGAIQPVMQTHKIPGMAVAVLSNGKRYVYNYGVTSRDTRQPITGDTLFEIGSISKTLTATLAAYAQASGRLSFTDSASQHLPDLQGGSFDHITLLNLGTHTSGGLPLLVPDDIENNRQMMDHLKRWKADYAAGTRRTYSNPGIGLLGVITAKSLQQSFEDAIEQTLFPALGMTHSYIHVPAEQMNNYAQGYTKQDAPIRMQPGVFASEAYAVKSSAADMARFVEANLQPNKLKGELQQAVTDTHKGYFKAGEMVQGLVWERYPFPVTLEQLLDGNSDAMIFQATTATALNPPLPPQPDVWINKTGSTNGFAAYVAFIPSQQLGIVMLANKNYPIAARVTAAHHILTALTTSGESPAP